jgi:predicted peptidase
MNIEQKVLQPGDQRYTIAVPANYPDEGPVPLILALHFAGHGTPFYGRTVLEELVEPALSSLGAILLAPDCTAEAWNNPQSEADVITLLDYVSNSYPIDPKKVVVVGYSMGGSGAWYLAAQHPGRFSAAIVMSGWPPDEIDLVDWQVPIYVIHSRQDELIPLERTQSSVNFLAEQGAELELIVLDGITHFETYRFREPLRSAVPWIKKVWQGNGE